MLKHQRGKAECFLLIRFSSLPFSPGFCDDRKMVSQTGSSPSVTFIKTNPPRPSLLLLHSLLHFGEVTPSIVITHVVLPSPFSPCHSRYILTYGILVLIKSELPPSFPSHRTFLTFATSNNGTSLSSHPTPLHSDSVCLSRRIPELPGTHIPPSYLPSITSC